MAVSIVPTLIGQVGKLYLFGSVILGSYFLLHGARLARRRTNQLARRLVLASVVYLPLVYALMMLDKVWA